MIAWLFTLFCKLGLLGIAQAQSGTMTPPPSGTMQPITLVNPLSCTGGTSPVQCVTTSIIDGLFKISIPIVAIMVLVGAFQIMTAAGNSEKVTKGRTTILYAVVGFAIVLLAESVAVILQNLLGAPSP